MTSTAHPPDETLIGSDVTRPTSVIADRLSHLIRNSQRFRAPLRGDLANEFRSSANGLIATLVREGPMRMTALAAAADADLSNVSRQVAELVRGELIERRPDPSDRRACLLAPTTLARQRYADHLRVRDETLGSALSQWSLADRTNLARLLTRLAEDLQRDDFQPPMMDLARSAERPAPEDSNQKETA